MKKIEISGRTTEEALQTAAQQLGVSVEDLEYEIVEEGSKGFLGLGQTPTSVTVWVREGAKAGPSRPEPPQVPRNVKDSEATTQQPAQVEEPAEEEDLPSPGADSCEAVASESEPPDEMEAGMSTSAREIGNDLVTLLGDVLSAMRLDAKPALQSADDEEIVIDIAGKDVAILIGKQGQTLDALQYLVGIAAVKTRQTRLRVILDAEGYRERQRDMLHRRALEYAKAVVEAGEEAVLEPQPARDRRIIHLALADHPEVYTYSEGVGEDRHVVISPKK